MESLKPFIVEEAYEVLEAIDEKNPEAVKEELGDLLFQIVFQCQIAKERVSLRCQMSSKRSAGR